MASQLPPDDSRDQLRKLKTRMQGYKEPPAPPIQQDEPPITEPSENKELTEEPVPTATPDPVPVLPKSRLSAGLLARFADVSDIESDRYHTKPWRQLPNETALEYALFTEYLKPPLAKGRDIDNLSALLAAPALSGWYDQLLNTLPVPKYVNEGYEVNATKTPRGRPRTKPGNSEQPAHGPEAETRALWWLADRNYWHERGRLYDAWGMELLVEERKKQVQTLAHDLDTQYRNHLTEMAAILQEVRNGVLANAVTSKGQLVKKKEIHQIPALGEITDTKTGRVIREATPFITREIEFDPMSLIDTMFKLSDRLYGPLPNMLDGSVSTVLDQTLALPPTVKPNGDIEDNALTGSVPEGKRTSAPWLMDRLAKVQVDIDRRKQIEAPVQETGPGENIKPKGT